MIPVVRFSALSERSRIVMVAAIVLGIASCAHQAPPATPLHSQRPTKPVASDAQNRERARQALQKATVSSNEYSACVMFATSAHRGSRMPPDELANAAAASCVSKLDEFEASMTSYYELNPVRPASTATPRERAHADRVSLEQRAQDAVVTSLGKSD